MIVGAPFQLLPLTYNSLVVESTSRCNASCAMCYQAAGPKGSDYIGDASLTADDIKATIRDAINIPSLSPRFHLSGGEAFIKIADCLEVFRTARDVGYTDISATTNAFWARKPDAAQSICTRLREAGLLRMEISWDAWHLPYISGDAVSNAITACADAGIETNLRLLTSTSHDAAEALSKLRPESVNLLTISTCGPVFKSGRAGEALADDEFVYSSDLGGSCHAVLNLTVNAKGNVSPCCAGMDQTEELVFGNIREERISDIADYMNRSALLRVIVFEGVAALVPILKKAGVYEDQQYTNICHLCFNIFSNADRTAAVKAFFEQLEEEALRATIERLRSRMVAA